jgi:hypothetical protein
MATEPITIVQGQLRLPRFFLLAANLRRSDTVAGTIRSSLSLSGVVVGPLPALPLLIFAGLLPIRPISLQRLEVFARSPYRAGCRKCERRTLPRRSHRTRVGPPSPQESGGNDPDTDSHHLVESTASPPRPRTCRGWRGNGALMLKVGGKQTAAPPAEIAECECRILRSIK